MKKIDALLNKWNSLQPLRPEEQKRLDEKFNLEFNYNSNHIEGNTLTYGQTKLLLMFNETTGSASLNDYQEMKAHNVGLEMVKRYAKEINKPLTESFICELNHTILVQDYWTDAKTLDGKSTRMEVKVGRYKTRPNSVITATQETFEYASPKETPILMAALVKWFNEEFEKRTLNPIELASLFHYRYIRIHPFENGNGRIARLLVNYILYKFNYPMLIVKSEDKRNYLRILHLCDVTCGLLPSDGANATIANIQPFVTYVKQQLEYALDISIKAAEGKSIDEEGDWKKKLALKLAEKKVAPKRTREIIENVRANQLIPFYQYIEQELSAFYSLFNKVEWFPYPPMLDLYNEVFSFTFMFDMQQEKGEFEVKCEWELYQYRIKIVTPSVESIELACRYDSSIPEEFRETAMNAIGDYLCEKLESVG